MIGTHTSSRNLAGSVGHDKEQWPYLVGGGAHSPLYSVTSGLLWYFLGKAHDT